MSANMEQLVDETSPYAVWGGSTRPNFRDFATFQKRPLGREERSLATIRPTGMQVRGEQRQIRLGADVDR